MQAPVGYAVLGPLEVSIDGRPVELASANQRTILVALLFDANRVVSADRLVTLLWERDMPSDPRAALRTQMARLRRRLGPAAAALTTCTNGYRLAVEPAQLDLLRFHEHLAAAASSAGAPRLAALERAVALWRGPIECDGLEAEITRLEALYRNAAEERAQLLVELDRPADAVAVASELIERDPTRERTRAILIEALYRSGRQADALAEYQAWRGWLAEELGLDPSPALVDLEGRILRHEIAPIRRPVAAPDGLPIPTSSFIGREEEVERVVGELEQARVVTLVGPGGVGKTRVALATARLASERSGLAVVFCDLAAVRRGGEVIAAIATAARLQERGRGRLIDQLIYRFRGQRLVLLVDNCEHVIEAAARVAEKLTQHTPVTVLATSREPLGVDGEHVVAIGPLAGGTSDAPAVRLFADRAGAAGAVVTVDDQRLVESICDRLDGLPLAIELAAARARALPLDQLLSALDDRFDVLVAGRRGDRRHGSLRSVVEWSYSALGELDRTVFDTLAVFVSAFDLDAARAVVDGATRDAVTGAVARLVDRSMLNRDAREGRYSMLETLRAFGRERLADRGQLDGARASHARWAVTIAEQGAAALPGPAEPSLSAALDGAVGELRAAFDFLVGSDAAAALQLCVALDTWSLVRNRGEVFRWAEVAAAGAAGVGQPRLLAAALGSAALGASRRGDLAATAALARAARAADAGEHRAVSAEAELALLTGELVHAEALFAEAADRASAAGAKLHAVWNSGGAALALLYRGGDPSARVAQTARAAEAAGGPSARAFARFVAAESCAAEDVAVAEARFIEAIELAEAAGADFVAGVAEVSLAALRGRNDPPVAVEMYEQVITRWRSAGAWAPQWITLRGVVDLLARLGEDVAAGRLLGAVRAASSSPPVYGSDEELLAAAETALVARIGRDRVDVLLHEGAALDEQAVVDLALTSLRGGSAARTRHPHITGPGAPIPLR